MAISQLLNIPSTALFLLAPPAWGKTSRLKDWFENSHYSLLIYVSPLRALADEVEESFAQFEVLNIRQHKDLEEFYGKKRVLIVTPEKINGELCRWISSQKNGMVFLDEFHLYDHWSSFRQQMLVALYDLVELNFSMMVATATLSENALAYWSYYFSLNYNQVYMIDIGNYRLKNYPVRWRYWMGDYYYYLHFLLWSQRLKKSHRTILCFCPYRDEVFETYRHFKQKGFNVLCAVGGQTTLFRKELKKASKPELIVSTIALSHGVNLPDLASVFFTYKETNRDYFTQMVARAGRRGEKYSVWLPQMLSFPRFF